MLNEECPPVKEQSPYQIRLEGFHPQDLVHICGDSILDTSRQIGQLNQDAATLVLKEVWEDIGDHEYQLALKYGRERINYLHHLNETNSVLFTTPDGINHLDRYIQSIKGFCEGSGLSEEEAYILQSNEVGCQTVGVRNKNSGEIVLAHMEEDTDEYDSSGDASKNKKWITVEENGKKYEFCNYPFFFTYGPAYGVIESKGNALFMASDYISPQVPESQNKLDPTLVTFLLMDGGSIDNAKTLIQNLKQLPDVGFSGGFICHLLEGGTHPQLMTIEFGHRYIGSVPPKESSTREVNTGVNYPNTPILQKVDEITSGPEDQLKEQQKEGRRLTWYGLHVAEQHDEKPWGRENAMQVINIIQSPGNIRSKDGKWKTGLSNPTVAQHCAVYVEPNKPLQIVARKGFLR